MYLLFAYFSGDFTAEWGTWWFGSVELHVCFFHQFAQHSEF